MNNPKIIALYLPQFHSIPENDLFWGKGFTDWVTVRKANPLFKGHLQPRVPLNKNYYDLSRREMVEQQCALAEEYGIYAFAVYHYWFNDEKNILTAPAEIMRDSTVINTKYYLTWDNCSWIRSWSNVAGNDWAPITDSEQKKTGPAILIEYILGKEDSWRHHYEYIRTHFFSDNYMKIGNKPVFSILDYSNDIDKMCHYWDKLAKEDGFDGIYFIYKYNPRFCYPHNCSVFNYEPHLSTWGDTNILRRLKNGIRRRFKITKAYYVYDYDVVWRKVLKTAKQHNEKNFFHCGFVGYDDSPRRGKRNSRVILGGSPLKFKRYMHELIAIANRQDKEYLFVTAWNEWGEGAYLEPDEDYGLQYLEALRSANKESTAY